jgi:hypothetical protein
MYQLGVFLFFRGEQISGFPLVTGNLTQERKTTTEIETNLQVQYTFALVATEENLIATRSSRKKPWFHMYIGQV